MRTLKPAALAGRTHVCFCPAARAAALCVTVVDEWLERGTMALGAAAQA
jgi:hypothetical protein